MLLDFNGTTARVQISEESTIISKHTGASLSLLKVQAVVTGQQSNDEFLSLINQAKTGNIASVNDNNDVQKRWKVKNTSWSYRDGDPLYYHTLELEEIEELNLSSLTLGELTIQPYEYKESFEEDNLNIKAKVVLSDTLHNKLKAMEKSGENFSVIRHGINEESIQMRIGIGYWSEHDAEFKHEILLFEEGPETKPNPLASAFRWMRPMRNQVADTKAALDSLVSILLSKSILDESEVDIIYNSISEASWDIRYNFFKVDDIDEI